MSLSSNEQAKIVQINIPDKYHGKLIGKQGSNIKLIRENLNVKIEFYNQLKEGENKNLYNVLIASSNSEQNCIEAKNRLLKQVNQFITEEEDIETKIFVQDENFNKVHAFWNSIKNECEKLNLRLIFLKEKKHFDGRVVNLNLQVDNIKDIFLRIPKGGFFNVIIKKDNIKNGVNNGLIDHSHRRIAFDIHKRRKELKELSVKKKLMVKTFNVTPSNSVTLEELSRVKTFNVTSSASCNHMGRCSCNWTREQIYDYETYYH